MAAALFNPSRTARALHLFTRSDCFSIPRKLDEECREAIPMRNAPRWQPKSISSGGAERSSQAAGMEWEFSCVDMSGLFEGMNIRTFDPA